MLVQIAETFASSSSGAAGSKKLKSPLLMIKYTQSIIVSLDFGKEIADFMQLNRNRHRDHTEALGAKRSNDTYCRERTEGPAGEES